MPRLIVEPPLPGPLAQGVVFIPYRVEHLRILPVAGPAARKVSPRVGHLHITVDDLPWLWADFGQSNTIVLAGMPRGQHKVLIELVDAEGNVLTAETLTFHSPGKEIRSSMKPHTPTMRNARITVATMLLAAGALVLQVAQAQQPGITRTELTPERSQHPRTRGDPGARRVRAGRSGSAAPSAPGRRDRLRCRRRTRVS